MTLTEKTAAIAATLGLSYSVTDDAAYLLRDGTVVGVVDDRDRAKELDVFCYFVNKGQIFSIHTYVGSGNVVAGSHGKIEVPTPTRQRVDAADIKSRYTVLDVWRMLMPQSAPMKDGVYHSPFRDDRNPSFSISQQGRKWKDFSSDEGGDCIAFAMKAIGCSFVEAINHISSGEAKAEVLPTITAASKVLSVTETQKAMEIDAIDGWNQWFRMNKETLDDSVLSRLIESKGIPIGVLESLHNEGSFGVIDGKPVYFLKYGLKIRHEFETSRSSRWLCGKPHGYLWRHDRLDCRHIKQVIITESETDLMKLASIVPQGLSRLLVSAPSASWRPTADYTFLVGAHRSVVIWFDNDRAGIEAAIRLEADFSNVSNCKVVRVIADEPMGKDVCSMSDSDVRLLVGKFVLTDH